MVRALALGVLLTLAAMAAVLAETPAQAPSGRNVMPLKDVRPGLKGIGYTVIHGTKVEPFDVEVLGVVPQAGPMGELILVRVSGPLIDETGGIAAGMSGSPVLVDGKFIGAVSYGFSFTDHRVGFLTPIEQMLPILDLAKSGKSGTDETKPLPKQLTVGHEVPLPPAVPLATPLMVSGANDRVLRRLKGIVEPLGYRVEQSGQGAGGGGVAAGSSAEIAGDEGAFVPGSAFGAALVTGDISVTAIGTVTFTEGDFFLGFGHPFLNKGRVALPVSLAEIYQTVRSQEAPFKLGAPRTFTGTLLEDRPSAVAGRARDLPPSIELKVAVEDLDRHERKSFTARVVPDESLATDLVTVAALQGLDRGLARIGRGTAEVRLVLHGEGLPGGSAVRENTFFSPADVSAAALRDLFSGVGLIVNNPFRPVELTQIELSARVSEERRTGVIEKAQLVRDRPVVPGEVAEIEVVVRPYRGEARRERLSLPIPADFAPGRYGVAVHGGGVTLSTPDEAETPSPSEDGGHVPNPEKVKAAPSKPQEPKTGAESFEALLDQFLRRDRNNELVAEIVDLGGETEESSGPQTPAVSSKQPPGHPPIRQTGKAAPSSPAKNGGSPKARLLTQYVVLGLADLELEVGKPQGPPQKPPPPARWERPQREP